MYLQNKSKMIFIDLVEDDTPEPKETVRITYSIQVYSYNSLSILFETKRSDDISYPKYTAPTTYIIYFFQSSIFFNFESNDKYICLISYFVISR